jgi:hypothetical protein
MAKPSHQTPEFKAEAVKRVLRQRLLMAKRVFIPALIGLGLFLSARHPGLIRPTSRFSAADALRSPFDVKPASPACPKTSVFGRHQD